MRNVFIAIGIIVIAFFTLHYFSARADTLPPVRQVQFNNTNFTYINDEVNANTIDKVLLDITKSNPDVPYYLYLDSPGGNVLEGRRLVNYLSTTNRNIVCVAHTAISMAYVILQACPVRLVTSDGILMTHQIAGGAQGSLSQMEAALQFTQKLADFYDNLMAARMGLTLEAYRAKINPEFWMVGSKEGLLNHAADFEVKVTCTKALEKATQKIGEGKDAVTISKCPIA